ncbi:methylated-DNA--[protein]-cysteine S-methyltransferase [Alsobacter sp. R-9]
MTGPAGSGPVADYALIRRLVATLSTTSASPAALEAAALRMGLGRAELDALLQRWGGLSVPGFALAGSPGHARSLVGDAQGGGDLLSRPSRTVVLPVRFEAPPHHVRGNGLRLSWGFHPSPFGEALVLACDGALAALGFVDDGDRAAALDDMRRRWPAAALRPDSGATGPLAEAAFSPQRWSDPLPVVLLGPAFDVAVWTELAGIPVGGATTYGALARTLGHPPGAARAVGGAVGRNPISFVIPCHRVIGRDGSLTGYHWGVARKQAMLAWEAGLVGTT